MRIDHVIIGARDVDEIRDLLARRYGFGMIQGSAHADGTQGWLVPFDTPLVQYLEVLTPGDPDKLAGDEFGQVFLDRTAAGPVLLNWALLSDDIDEDATRVGELTGADPQLLRGESVRADGRRFPWAEAAFAASWRRPSHPFFLEYGDWPSRTGRVAGDLARAAHRRAPVEFVGLTVSTADVTLPGWWAGADLPVEVLPGVDERVVNVRIRTADGEVEVALP